MKAQGSGRKRIVVLGAGFGGAYTFKYLHQALHGDESVELVLVNSTNYFLFTPLLHEVATGGVSPGVVTEPLRKVLGCCLSDFYLADVEKVDLNDNLVGTRAGDISFDYLVVALGATTNFFGVPGAKENSFTLKSLPDAVRLKNQIISKVECATKEINKEKRQKMLRFAVIGGGPTGVELAAELADFCHDTVSKLYKKSPIIHDIEVVLVELSDRLLGNLSEEIGDVSKKVLEKKGVVVKLKEEVSELSKSGVVLSSGEILETDTPIWVAGVMPQPVEVIGDVNRDRSGRLIVDDTLQLRNRENVFVIGDMAYFTNSGDSRPVPALAQVATRQAKGASDNIIKLLKGDSVKPYYYKHAGDMVSLGHWMAVANINNLLFTGRFAWWLWRTVYLFKLLSFRKKVKVAVDWTFDLFVPRDISQL